LEKLQVEKWSCESCTFLNSSQDVHCQVCGELRFPGYEAAPGDEQSADEVNSLYDKFVSIY